MNFGFDGRVFEHKTVTGVERFSRLTLNELYKIAQIKVYAPPQTSNRYFEHLWTYTGLPMRCSLDRVDALYCPASSAPFNLSPKIGLVVTIHDISYLRFPEHYSRSFSAYYKFVLPHIIKRADAITTVSNAELKNIVEHFPEASTKTSVVYPGISEKFLNLGLERKPIILAVGSINKHKNLTALVKAFSRSLEYIPHKLIIVGGKRDIISSDSELHAAINCVPSDRIEIMGHIPDVDLIELYNRAEIFVFPSLFEGFGAVPLEAMASGCAVIASNASAIPEVCKHAAYYFDPKDVTSLADAIILVAKDTALRESLVSAGKERSSLFSYKRTALEINELLNFSAHKAATRTNHA